MKGWSNSAAMALLFLGALAALAAQLAPLGLYAGAGASPDLVYCVVAYFALRHPRAAHPLLIFAIGLVQDMLTSGPFGAGMLTLLLMSEVLRGQSFWLIRRSVSLEWATVAFAAFVMLAVQWLMLTLSFADPPPLLELAPRLMLTIAAFPLVAAFYRYALRIGAVGDLTGGNRFGAA